VCVRVCACVQEIVGLDMFLKGNLNVNMKIFNCASRWLPWDGWGRRDKNDEASRAMALGGGK
jgi:hypothetical protein